VRTLDTPTAARIEAWPLWDGEIAGTPVVLAKTGLGKVNTAALAALVWQRRRPDIMIFSGVAGGLDPNLRIGDIVVGRRSIQHDAGILGPHGLERYQAGHLPFYNPTDDFGFAPSERLIDIARRAVAQARLESVLDRQPAVVFGTILTGDQFLSDPRVRGELFHSLGAQAVEMEGAALAQTAHLLGTDHLIIRSLSDLASGESVEHFDRFAGEVALNSARIVIELLGLL
jgi:adenosylhomocysteine nucleosidase